MQTRVAVVGAAAAMFVGLWVAIHRGVLRSSIDEGLLLLLFALTAGPLHAMLARKTELRRDEEDGQVTLRVGRWPARDVVTTLDLRAIKGVQPSADPNGIHLQLTDGSAMSLEVRLGKAERARHEDELNTALATWKRHFVDGAPASADDTPRVPRPGGFVVELEESKDRAGYRDLPQNVRTGHITIAWRTMRGATEFLLVVVTLTILCVVVLSPPSPGGARVAATCIIGFLVVLTAYAVARGATSWASLRIDANRVALSHRGLPPRRPDWELPRGSVAGLASERRDLGKVGRRLYEVDVFIRDRSGAQHRVARSLSELEAGWLEHALKTTLGLAEDDTDSSASVVRREEKRNGRARRKEG